MAASAVEEILERVYGPFTCVDWRPKAFSNRCSRYLWSDAFGVCNFLSLYDAKGQKDERYLDQADALIDAVHCELGCLRGTNTRLGSATKSEPTLGGLRIGKEQEDDDGQYFHYLTKWMFALSRMAIARKDPRYTRWAIHLAKSVHDRFVVRGRSGRPLRMVWKLSVDLQHVLVSSEGNLDPFDGLVTYRLLQRQSDQPNVLRREINDMQALVDRKLPTFATSEDPLDAGEALWLSEWFPHEHWTKTLRSAGLASIGLLVQRGHLSPSFPLHHRLLFREMGTALGLRVAVRSDQAEYKAWQSVAQELLALWRPHLYERDADISPLMFASALLPGVWDPHAI